MRQHGRCIRVTANDVEEIAQAARVARQVFERGRPFAGLARPALVNGGAGLVVGRPGRPIAVVGFTVARGRIVEIDLITDPEKLARIEER